VSWAKVLPSRSDADGGFDNFWLIFTPSSFAMGQKSSLPQSILAVSQALTPDIACVVQADFPRQQGCRSVATPGRYEVLSLRPLRNRSDAPAVA
jgi:hypothetical protein